MAALDWADVCDDPALLVITIF